MKVGIRNIRYIPVNQIGDYSMLPPGASFNLSAFLNGDLQELPFTPESADFSENWPDDDKGNHSDVSLSAIIRADKESVRPVLMQLQGKKHIFEVELINGLKYVIGSKEYVPTFSFSDNLSGISKNSFSIKITNKSLHGVLFNKN